MTQGGYTRTQGCGKRRGMQHILPCEWRKGLELPELGANRDNEQQEYA